ncbi:MAG TPA: GHKL domain-containing protein [Candidatus Pullilachnospira gallistercoris]|uniref:GHKL domain-containing protein n=1 Tax=Candidatus Pullilachnospira gallistercoris TaxID=2840911 RepID=A0A9D1EB85_9FIRM|nr:GHKL domain-containing protein [Candidatus Pullilachnospira gallistercoris]
MNGHVSRRTVDHTTKKDKKNHGLGIGNIRQCVDRCHGLLEIDDGSRLPQDQRIFCIDILLPNRI